MRSGKFCVAGISLLVVGGCAEDAARVHGNQALGVAQFQVSSSAQRLDVQGLGADGQLVAAVHLGVRIVRDGDNDGMGRSLTIELPGGPDRTFESIGLDPIRLAPPADAKLDALLLDPYVAELLAGRGIIMGPAEPSASPSETEYGGIGDCSVGIDSWIPQCMGTGFTACCLAHPILAGYTPQSVACGNASPKATADRACFAVPTCTSGKPYDTTPVGCDTLGAVMCPAGTTGFQASDTKFQCQVNGGAPNQCPGKAVGPLGCATCWTASYTGAMGFQYDNATNTCTYINTFKLTVTTQQVNGEGEVTSSPPGIDVDSPFSAVASFPSGQVVTLTALRGAAGVITIITGPCIGTGNSCNVTMDADKTVNVKFQCPSGSNCAL